MGMNKSHNNSYTGSCLCGEVRYEVQHIGRKMGHCHCSMCRKFHGAAFATFGEAKAGDFRWTQGKELLQSYVADNGTTRQFCKQCGASLTFSAANNESGKVEFALGTLDSKISQRPDAHIYTAYRADWCQIKDNLPKYLEGRDHSRGQKRHSHDSKHD